jgi:hypothetical protein
MFCTKCGAKLADDTVFCNYCGAKIGGGIQPTAVSESTKANTVKWESESVQVSPLEENETIRTYEMFGWELVSSQTIDNKDSHLKTIGDTLYSVTESTNYVKLVFRRNVNMPNYKKIVQLEEDYDLSYPPEEPSKPSIGFLVGGVLLIYFGIGIPMIIYYVVKYIKYKKSYEEYLVYKEDAAARRTKCLEEMKALGIEPSDRIF